MLKRWKMHRQDLCCIADFKGYFRRVNPAWSKTFGYSESELLTRPYLDFIHPEDYQLTTDEINKLVTGTQTEVILENRYRDINRLYHTLAWRATANQETGLIYAVARNITEKIRNQTGKVIGVVADDLTEQLQTQLDAQEELLTKIINTISDAIVVVNDQGEILFFNPQTISLLGRSQAQLKGHQLGLPIVKESSTNIELLRPDGKMIIAEMHIEKINWQKQNASLVSLRDITASKQAKEKLHKNEERLQSILGSLEDIVWSADPLNFDLIYINQAATKIFGYSPQQLSQDRQLWLNIIHPEDEEFVRDQLEAVKTKDKIEFVYRLIPEDQVCRWIYCRAWTVYNNEQETIRIDGIQTDITTKRQVETDLQRRIFNDNLTNLPNRDFFLSQLAYICQTLVQTREKYGFAVMILDIDEFKVINDGLGHSSGDQLLKEVALRLQLAIEPTDFIARLGGDEFGIILENTSELEQAIAVVKKIQACLEQPFQIRDNSEVFVKTSIGIAFSDANTITPDMLIRNADTALYHAKAMGKDNYAIFNQEMHAIALNRLDREQDLRYALENNGLVLHYQPIISLINQKILGFEALLRLQHPTQGLLSPVEFIAIAEETGLIVPIGLWILREGCQQIKQWHRKFPQYNKLKLNINLSVRQFNDPLLISSIDAIFAETQLNPEFIKLEITESLFIEEIEQAITLLHKLRDRNLKICLDDFGTGYSSLSYLHRFPLNTLKIDRCFVTGLETSVESVQIIKIIINLAHSLGLDTVAEGVETTAQLESLKSLGCDQVQGYLLSRPLSVTATEAYLQQHL
jgi:diguanylate cyclase (GGDEF)-like protein/PAS domain S-box-containing protein